jgi:hypothetical protein
MPQVSQTTGCARALAPVKYCNGAARALEGVAATQSMTGTVRRWDKKIPQQYRKKTRQVPLRSGSEVTMP